MKATLRSVLDHCRYSRMSDAAKIRRLLAVYDVFKRYRPRAKEEKILKATAGVYFDVMKWKKEQALSALSIIGPKIGREIKSVKDLTKSILVLKKPCLGSLYDPGYEDRFRTIGKMDKTIDLVLSENPAGGARTCH